MRKIREMREERTSRRRVRKGIKTNRILRGNTDKKDRT